jgi:hypothetical protein
MKFTFPCGASVSYPFGKRVVGLTVNRRRPCSVEISEVELSAFPLGDNLPRYLAHINNALLRPEE